MEIAEAHKKVYSELEENVSYFKIYLTVMLLLQLKKYWKILIIAEEPGCYRRSGNPSRSKVLIFNSGTKKHYW